MGKEYSLKLITNQSKNYTSNEMFEISFNSYEEHLSLIFFGKNKTNLDFLNTVEKTLNELPKSKQLGFSLK